MGSCYLFAPVWVGQPWVLREKHKNNGTSVTFAHSSVLIISEIGNKNGFKCLYFIMAKSCLWVI